MTSEAFGHVRADRTLWVCWAPPALPEGPPPTILSFLPPSVEEEFERQYSGCVLRAREVSHDVRMRAKAFYIDLVSRIGTATVKTGQSLRQALTSSGEVSRWWFHPVAFRDCESDPTFNWLIAILTIQTVVEKSGHQALVLVGASAEIVAVLRSAYRIKEQGKRRLFHLRWLWGRGLASRFRYVMMMLRYSKAARRHCGVPEGPYDVVFSGFWDWSVRPRDLTGSFEDKYFQLLPDQLRFRRRISCGWFAWLDPKGDPTRATRPITAVLAPLKNHREVVILQAFLRPGDIIRSVTDFRPLAIFLRVRKKSVFREIFREKGLDFYPLFAAQLLQGFLNPSLPHGELVVRAVKRACKRLKPKVSMSFLEHFPYSRAYYAGIRSAGGGTICVAVQHASANHEKTFLFLHPSREFRGEPDGCAVPHPDYVCTMGTLGQELFLECGYPTNRVFVTGSPRYDHLFLAAAPILLEKRSERRGMRLLIVASLSQEVEMDMIEAVCVAARGLVDVKVSLREHPFSPLSTNPRFALFKNFLEITQGSLSEDLARADLILFTYSTVAEEAFLQGKPVWQWFPMGFDGSALAAVADIPRFSSPVTLRKALTEFLADPSRFQPDLNESRRTLERLFFRADGGAASRVADLVWNLLRDIHSN